MTPAKLRQLADLAARKQGTARLFVLAEAFCVVASWMTLLALAGTTVLSLFGVELPFWASRFVLPILTNAMVGYVTNYLAVTMLFEPYTRAEGHWIRWITAGLWRQGLIPARRGELAESVGQEVSGRLLTPEAITEEVSDLLVAALDDERLRGSLRTVLGPALRENLPVMIDRLTPEILSLLRQGITEGFHRENLRDFIEKVLDPWLASRASRERLVGTAVKFLRKQTPRLVSTMREVAENYRRRHYLHSLFLGVAEYLGALDWRELEEAIDEGLASPENRGRVIDTLADLGPILAEALEGSELEPIIESLKDRSSDYLGVRLETFLAERLPEAGQRLVDTPAFWRWLVNEAVPRTRPHLLAWLERDGVEVVGRRFDVVGRVRHAVAEMDVRGLHEMVDGVATEQMGAIQVLGYLLGFTVGVLLSLTDLLAWLAN